MCKKAVKKLCIVKIVNENKALKAELHILKSILRDIKHITDG